MAKPQAPEPKLRELVRDVLEIASGLSGVEDAYLFASVRELLRIYQAADSDILAAAEWNLARDYIRHAMNDDTDNREWFITREGMAKQRLK